MALLPRLANPEQDQADGVSSWATEESREGLLGVTRCAGRIPAGLPKDLEPDGPNISALFQAKSLSVF